LCGNRGRIQSFLTAAAAALHACRSPDRLPGGKICALQNRGTFVPDLDGLAADALAADF
jgi:hypothetical protein